MASKRVTQKTSTSLQPIDRGWSWMVCLSGSVIRFLLNGLWTSLGLFFLHWERDFESSASSVSIIGSIIMCQWFMGPFVSALSHTFTHRQITVVSGLVVAVSFTIGSQLAQEIWHLYIVSAFAVLGLGCAWQISVVHVTYFFQDKLGVAVSIVTGFAAAGTLVLPPLLQLCLENMGWRGAMLILAGLMCNITAVAFLLRSVISEQLHKPALEKTNSMGAKLKHGISKCGTSFHFDMFCKSIPFWVTWFLGLANGMAFGPMFVFIAPHAVKYDISEFRASLLIVTMGICSLVARFSSGIVVDKNILSSWKFYSLYLAICGVSCILLTIQHNYWYLVLLSALFGASNGGIESLYVLVFVDLVGKENTAASYAWGNSMWALGGVISLYLGGFLYDTTGSYKPVFYLAGCILICAAALTLSTKQMQKLQAKLENNGGPFYCNVPENDLDEKKSMLKMRAVYYLRGGELGKKIQLSKVL